MSDQTNTELEIREKLRQQIQEKFGQVESIGIEPLLDEALEHVAGGVEESSDICSWMWCSHANNDLQENAAVRPAVRPHAPARLTSTERER
jgi:hypothetical protein